MIENSFVNSLNFSVDKDLGRQFTIFWYDIFIWINRTNYFGQKINYANHLNLHNFHLYMFAWSLKVLEFNHKFPWLKINSLQVHDDAGVSWSGGCRCWTRFKKNFVSVSILLASMYRLLLMVSNFPCPLDFWYPWANEIVKQSRINFCKCIFNLVIT